MLILRGPGGFEGGRVIDALVSHIDLFPTICDLLEIERPDWLQGESLMPLVRGEADEIRDAIFAEGTYHAAYEPQRGGAHASAGSTSAASATARTPVLVNTDDSPSKELWLEHGWRDRPVAPEQLYDLVLRPRTRRTTWSTTSRTCRARRATCASASSAGCARPTTRCSTGRCRRRPAPSSTTPTSSRRASRPTSWRHMAEGDV